VRRLLSAVADAIPAESAAMMAHSIPIAADTLEARLIYALKLAAGANTTPQVIIVKDEVEKR
jgi:hypothetical protein